MALHDYQCPACARVSYDQYRPISLRASQMPVVCVCGYLMTWIPQVGAMDAKEPFQRFDVQVRQPDGSSRTVTIDSTHTLRRVERESEQAYANGEGQPLRFRMWSQNRSNGDVNTFGPDPGQVAHDQLARAALQPKVTPHDAQHATLGPGVTEATMSPLPAA